MPDVYSHRPLEPEELPSVMRKHIYTGAMAAVYVSIIVGLFFVDFGNRMGLSYWHWGLITATKTAAMLFQLVGARVSALSGRRKKLWFRLSLAGRLLRGAGIVLAFHLLPFSAAAAIALLISLTTISRVCNSVSHPPWASWLSDIIPRRLHGAFMGRRRAWTAATTAVALLSCGLVLDWAGEGARMETLLVVFAAALAFGWIDVFIHRTIPEPEGMRTTTKSILSQAAFVLRDRVFRPLIVFRACWTFSMFLGLSLSTVYFAQDLGFTHRMLVGVTVLRVIPSIATAVSSAWTGRLVDRLGVRKVLLGAHLVWSFLPVCWLLATEETAAYWLTAAAIIGGVASPAGLTAVNKVTLYGPARSERAMYAAVSSCVTGLVGTAAPLITGFLLEGLKGWSTTVLGRAVGGFHVLFLASFVLRLASTLLATRVPEPKSYSDEFAPV